MSWLRILFDYAVVHPLRLFYHHGPIWKGTSLPDVCAQITGVDASFWAKQSDQCQIAFDRQFHSFGTGIGVTVYFTAMLIGVFYLACRCCFLRPMATEIARAFQKNIKREQKDDVSTNSRPCGHAHCRGNSPVEQA